MKSSSRNTCATIANPEAVEYYLCGPPMMIKACTKMLAAIGVPNAPDRLRRILEWIE